MAHASFLYCLDDVDSIMKADDFCTGLMLLALSVGALESEEVSYYNDHPLVL